MNFYGKQQPLSLNVGYKFDNGNELSVDFSKIKEDNQKSTTTRTTMKPGFWQDKVQTIYNDNKRTDYAITYKGSDDKQDWMFRAYKSVFDKNYKNQNNTRMTMMGRPGKWTLQDPKIDTVKRTLSVIEGKDTFNLSDKNKLTAGLNIVRTRAKAPA